jgi:hypothetical protein
MFKLWQVKVTFISHIYENCKMAFFFRKWPFVIYSNNVKRKFYGHIMRLDDLWLQTTLNIPNISGVWQIKKWSLVSLKAHQPRRGQSPLTGLFVFILFFFIFLLFVWNHDFPLTFFVSMRLGLMSVLGKHHCFLCLVNFDKFIRTMCFSVNSSFICCNVL